MKKTRLTVAQALIKFLQNQYVSRDGEETPFFAGCFGIFGHGNVAGIGQALQEFPDLPYYQCRNEQAMVHTAMAYAKVKDRTQAFACTTSIGPGATNMVTGAATATINRMPVLLLPGDNYARREPNPVLQQVEYTDNQDATVTDCFKPVSKYWDRINRAEQLIYSLPAAMRVLTSPADTGAVTICMPQDVQAEAYDFPDTLFRKRVWYIPRNRPDESLLDRAVELIKSSENPVIVSGGGTIYSGATTVLNELAAKTGIPVGETYAGKGAVPYDKPYSLGGLGATGTKGAITIAEAADVVIGVGTRYSDFISGSNSLWQNAKVQFININVCELDAYKNSGLALTGDAKVVLTDLLDKLGDFQVAPEYREKVKTLNEEWEAEVARIYQEANGTTPPIHQSGVLGALNDFMEDTDVVVSAAGSMPGDLHKLWRSSDPKNFHLEYGNSCMGYEIAGGLGAKMAAPEREVYVLVGDASYLMLNSEVITSIQEDYKLIIVLSDNSGYASIGSLSASIGSERFGTKYRFRENGKLDGGLLPVDLGQHAASMGAHVLKASTLAEFKDSLKVAKTTAHTTVIHVTTDIYRTVQGYHAWWEVPIAEVSTSPEVQEVRKAYVENKKKQRYYL